MTLLAVGLAMPTAAEAAEEPSTTADNPLAGILGWAVIAEPGPFLAHIQNNVNLAAPEFGQQAPDLLDMIGRPLGNPGLTSVDMGQPMVVLIKPSPALIGEPQVSVAFHALDPAPWEMLAQNQGYEVSVVDGRVHIGQSVIGHEASHVTAVNAAIEMLDGYEAAGGIEFASIAATYGPLARAGLAGMFNQMGQMRQMLDAQGMSEMGNMIMTMVTAFSLGGMHMLETSERLVYRAMHEDDGALLNMVYSALPDSATGRALAGAAPDAVATDGRPWSLLGGQPGVFRMAGSYNGATLATWIDDMAAAINADPLCQTPLSPSAVAMWSDLFGSINGSVAGVWYQGPDGLVVQDTVGEMSDIQPTFAIYQMLTDMFGPAGPVGQALGQAGINFTVTHQQAARQIDGVDIHAFDMLPPPMLVQMGQAEDQRIEYAWDNGLMFQRTNDAIDGLIQTYKGTPPAPLPLIAAERFPSAPLVMDMDLAGVMQVMAAQDPTLGDALMAAPIAGGVPSQMAVTPANGSFSIDWFVPNDQVMTVIRVIGNIYQSQTGAQPLPF